MINFLCFFLHPLISVLVVAAAPMVGFPGGEWTIMALVKASQSLNPNLQYTLLSYGTPPSDTDGTLPGIPLLALSFNISGGGLTALVRQRYCATNLWPSVVLDGSWHHVTVSWSKLSETLRSDSV